MDAVSVVVKEEEPDVNEVHDVALGEGERLAGEPGDALPEREIEALDMVCFSFLFGTGAVLLVGHDVLIRSPEVGEDQARLVGGRNLVPQLAAAEHGARTMMPSHDLPGATAQRNPQPHRVRLAAYIAPQLVQFQHISFLGRHQSLLHFGQRRGTVPQVTVFF